jgi:phage terminase large subunit-like protein
MAQNDSKIPVPDAAKDKAILPYYKKRMKEFGAQFDLGIVHANMVAFVAICDANVAKFAKDVKQFGDMKKARNGPVLSPYRRGLDRWTKNQYRAIAQLEKLIRSKAIVERSKTVDNDWFKLLAFDEASAKDLSFSSVYVRKAQNYVEDILAGKIPACREVIQACERQREDLRRAASDPEFGYEFNPYLAHRACAFMSKLPHVKGKWAREQKLLELGPWQCFIITTLFGWVRKGTLVRRFNEAYLEICRKNGKSIMAAAICLFMFCADREHGSEVYSGATSEKQAWEVFRPARMMVINGNGLREAAGIVVKATSLSIPRDGSRFEPVIGKPGDGASPSCAVADEYHEHTTSDLVDTMVTGMGSRDQPLMLKITTAGYDIASPCYDDREKAKQTLDLIYVNEQLFTVIYTIDLTLSDDGENGGDKWEDESSLIKANPNIGVSVDLEFLRGKLRSAIRSASEQNRFKTKHMNIWCAARKAWLSLPAWQALADVKLKPEAMKGCRCVFAVDLASKLDIAAFMMIFEQILGNKRHYTVFGRYYLPEDRFDQEGKYQVIYQKWNAAGLLTRTDGATTDFSLIEEDIIAAAKIFNPDEIVYDPFNATHMAQDLLSEGLNLVEFTQKPGNFAVPMDEVEAAVKDERLHHDGNAVLTWMIANVAIRPAKKGLFWPTQAAPGQKIDGPVAMTMGIARLMAPPVKKTKVAVNFL